MIKHIFCKNCEGEQIYLVKVDTPTLGKREIWLHKADDSSICSWKNGLQIVAEPAGDAAW